MHAPTLARWVGDTSAFMTTYWRRRPGVFRPDGGAPSPFTLADVDAAFATGLLREPYIEMTRADLTLSPSDYLSSRPMYSDRHDGFADERKISALLDRGATLLLRRVDQWHEPTRELLAALTGELGLPVEAFCFVTPAGRQGVPLHRDDADVLVVQTEGSKHWHVHEGPADGNWQQGRVDDDPPPEVMQATLRAGEVLYIPRGFAHRATGDSGLSAHLSLTVREVHMGDLFRSLHKIAGERMAVETRPLTDDAVLACAKGMLEHVRARLDTLSPEDLVRHARRTRLAQLPPAPRPPALTRRAMTGEAVPAAGREGHEPPGDAPDPESRRS
ncbi:JmjC domain-containing protein [Streptomyces sp. NPDC101234]|uniref:JmjC domain-containing protein n=1 Tax=Streptomyces sp. NPDC101234 TaxID=3366138 RepID=UPI00381941B3